MAKRERMWVAEAGRMANMEAGMEEAINEWAKAYHPNQQWAQE